MNGDGVNKAIGELTAEVRNLCRRIEDVIKRLDHHNERIAALERWRAYLAGAGVVLFGLVSYLLGK